MSEQISIRNAYDGSGNLIYYGQATPGTPTSTASWTIMQNTYDASNHLTASLWANGNNAAVNIWDNRASYQYS